MDKVWGQTDRSPVSVIPDTYGLHGTERSNFYSDREKKRKPHNYMDKYTFAEPRIGICHLRPKLTTFMESL